jgi:hypothetical protein
LDVFLDPVQGDLETVVLTNHGILFIWNLDTKLTNSRREKPLMNISGGRIEEMGDIEKGRNEMFGFAIGDYSFLNTCAQ